MIISPWQLSYFMGKRTCWGLIALFMLADILWRKASLWSYTITHTHLYLYLYLYLHRVLGEWFSPSKLDELPMKKGGWTNSLGQTGKNWFLWWWQQQCCFWQWVPLSPFKKMLPSVWRVIIFSPPVFEIKTAASWIPLNSGGFLRQHTK